MNYTVGQIWKAFDAGYMAAVNSLVASPKAVFDEFLAALNAEIKNDLVREEPLPGDETGDGVI